MGRFETALELELDKYRRMEPPLWPPARQAVVAIDCLATCCCGARPLRAFAGGVLCLLLAPAHLVLSKFDH